MGAESPLKSLLFADIEVGVALFANASDLARAVLRQKSRYNEKGEMTVAPLLAQILRSDRTCPEALQKLIVEAVRQRAKERSVTLSRDYVQRLEQAVRYGRGRRRGRDESHLFATLVNEAQTAAEQFIITATPAEEVMHHDRAKTLREILVRRFGLYKGARRASDQCRYTFCMPKPQADKFWRDLQNQVTGSTNPVGTPLGVGEATRKLKDLNHTRRLRLFALDEYLCASPVVMFLENDAPKKAFTLFYHDNPVCNVAEYNNTYLPVLRELLLRVEKEIKNSELKFANS